MLLENQPLTNPAPNTKFVQINVGPLSPLQILYSRKNHISSSDKLPPFSNGITPLHFTGNIAKSFTFWNAMTGTQQTAELAH